MTLSEDTNAVTTDGEESEENVRVVTPAIAAQFVMVFLSQIGMQIVAPTLPEIQAEFVVPTEYLGFVLASFGVARLVFDLPAGQFVDRLDRTWLLLVSLALMAVGSFGGAVAPSFAILIATRLVMGVGSSLLNTASLAVLTELADRRHRGRVIGYYQASQLAGQILSPAAGGLIAAASSWRMSFVFCGVMMTLAWASVMATRAVRRSSAPATPQERRQRGSSLSGPKLSRAGLFAIHFTSFGMFFSHTAIVTTAVPLYGSQVLDLGPATIGLALGFAGLSRLAVSLIGGPLSDRHGRLFILVPALVALGVGTLAMLLAYDVITYILIISIAGAGRVGNAIPSVILADRTPPERYGRVVGQNRFIADLGTLIGPLLASWLIAYSGYLSITVITAVLVWTAALWLTISVDERHAA
ncbi:MAG: MFS transporter [Chloroflexi bacterium]|nr:MFS transporter [Chloroflexota bacterium]